MFISSCHLFHYQVCLLVSSGLNYGRLWQQFQCHNPRHLIHILNPTTFFRPSTFSPVRLKSRYVSIQENRAFRKASLMILTSQKARKYATFRHLFIFPWQQTYRLHMARYVLIDISFRELIRTNVDCNKISPFVCGNISTNSVAKKYWYILLSISQPEPRLFFVQRTCQRLFFSQTDAPTPMHSTLVS